MEGEIYTFKVRLNFELLTAMSAIDRFSGEWHSVERRQNKQSLQQLKSIATVQSVGASTRIEGSQMTNDEVREFIFNSIQVGRLTERDQQEVLGYYRVLDIISASYHDISITENSIKNLHNQLLKHSEKDQYHKGKYKTTANSVVATHANGTKTTLFRTTPPGFETDDAMRQLLQWFRNDRNTPTLLKTAVLVYEFLSIHPFQDGNGRLSRLLGTLLLLKHDYPWIEYVSFENEIESRKAEYYSVLMTCQQKRPHEDITPWLVFFIDCLSRIQIKLRKKLDAQRSENQLSPRDQSIYTFIDAHAGAKSGLISKKLRIPLPTVKKILGKLVEARLIAKLGTGAGTNYITEKSTPLKTDVALELTGKTTTAEFSLLNRYQYLLIKKIILSPLFEWKKPSDWKQVLLKQNLMLEVTCITAKGSVRSQSYALMAFASDFHYEPVFTLNTPIHLPLSMIEKEAYDYEYPLQLLLKIKHRNKLVKFEVMLVYDAALE